MATSSRNLEILIEAKLKTDAGFKKAESGLNRLGAAAEKHRGKLLAVAGAVTAIGVASIKFASDLDEARNKAIVTFGAQADAVEAFASTAAESFGLSERAALEYSGTLGTILNASGLAADASAAMSIEMVALAGDLSSFNNIPIGDALDKLRSGIVGEAEPLRTLGVLISDAAVKTKALELGIGLASGALTEGEKVQARYALIVEQTSSQQGDFARTSESVANQIKIARAQMENAAATLGTQLLPAATKVIGVISKMAAFFADLDPVGQRIVLVILGIAGAVAGLLLILPTLISGIAALKTAMIALQTANPLLLALTAITLAVVLVIANWDRLQGVILNAVNWMTESAQKIINAWLDIFINPFIEAINAIGAAFGVHVDTLEVNFDRIEIASAETQAAVVENNTQVIASNTQVATSFATTADEAVKAAEKIIAAGEMEVAAGLAFIQSRLKSSREQRDRAKEIAEEEAQNDIEILEKRTAEIAEIIAKAQQQRVAESEFRTELREAELAETVRLLALEQDAIEAVATQSAADFARVRAAVMRLPSQIAAGGGIGPGGQDVASLFKASQNAVQAELAAARAALAAGRRGTLGGGTTIEMLEAEVARLLGITQGSAFRGGDLGRLVAPPGGGGPPLLPGQVFITVEGSILAEDLASTVEAGLAELAERGGTNIAIGIEGN